MRLFFRTQTLWFISILSVKHVLAEVQHDLWVREEITPSALRII
ncbi:putative GreA-associated domains protein [Trichinella pseudospiralis]